MADCNAALQEEATDWIDHGRPLPDQARSHTVQRLQVQLIVSLYWNAACRWPQHGFRNCVSVPEVVLVTLTEGLGISWRYLSHIMTERKQLAGDIVRRHTCLDPDQARRCIRKPPANPPASKLLTQDDRPPLIQADQVQRVLTRIDTNSPDRDASVFCNMAACSSCFDALSDRVGARPVHPILKIPDCCRSAINEE